MAHLPGEPATPAAGLDDGEDGLVRPALHRRLDAALWLVVCAAILLAVPIGFVSNDGLGHSREFVARTWALNPNHLLFEPLGAAWQSIWARLDPARAGVDALKLLSAVAGAAAVALFRLRVVPLVAERRWIANYATASVGLSSAFLRLWVSDEIHMIQLPFVVAFAGEALRLFARPTLSRGLRAGVAIGLATLCFVSNILLGASLALALLWGPCVEVSRRAARREVRRAAAGLAAAALLVIAPVFLLAAPHQSGAAGGLSWLTHGRLGADRPLARGESGYGLELSAKGLGEALLRSGYGAASALVDLSPLAAAVRDRQVFSAEAARGGFGGLVLLAAGAGLLLALRFSLRAFAPAPIRRTGWLAFVWLLPVLGFGFLWNNSDDQFYFQLAPIFGLLAAFAASHLARRRLWLALGLAALVWNLADVGVRRVFYPRAQRIAQMTAATAGACLVVLPGFDEAEMVFTLSPAVSSIDHLSIAEIATRWPPKQGLPHLLGRITDCTRLGRNVVFVDIFDTALERNPWKYLRRLGYDHAKVARRLEPIVRAAPPRRAGPFFVRSVD